MPLQYDPISVLNTFWPHETYYQKQRDIVYSIWNNDETIVPAGNMLGKDFIAGRIITAFFLSRYPCRIVTTSAKDDHLRVLWGEINNAINSSVIPLTADKGGPLTITHQNIKRSMPDGSDDKISYVIGMVASQNSIAAMQGHHVANVGDGIPRTLFVSDESSSVPDEYFTMARTWANRMFIFGNTWDCANYFYRAVEGLPGSDDKGGDIKKEDTEAFYRKIIKITAKDSPNVAYALREIELGFKPSGRLIVNGVKSYEEYQKNLKLMDKIQQSVSLEAEFYKGSEVRMFPKEWLDRSEEYASKLSSVGRRAKCIGVDTAEGGDSSSWCVVDEYGVLRLLSMKTPDTSIIPGITIGLMKEYNVPPEMTIFDRGGGGQQHADQLRSKGHKVRTVGFGESVTPERKRGTTQLQIRVEQDEERYTYKNRRAQMYHLVRLAIDPAEPKQFGIPKEYFQLRQQLTPIPLKYDPEGRIELPPKQKKDKDDKTVTLIDLIGHSPDEADSLAIAIYGMVHKKARPVAGGIG